MSKKMKEEQRAMEMEQRLQARRQGQPGTSQDAASPATQGVFGSMAQTLQERTQHLTDWSETMASLENSSANFAEQASKFVAQQKRKAVLGGLKNLF